MRKAELFKTIRATVNGRAAAFDLVRDLDRQARVYAQLRNPDPGGWASAERDCLWQLGLFGVRQPFAVLLAAFDRFAESDRPGFARFLKAIAVVSFRYNLICQRQSNEQEAVYNRIARRIANGEISEPSAAIKALRPVYPEDGPFRTAFAEKTLNVRRSRKVIRFILLRLERKLSGREFDFESDAYNIERVLPERPDEGWEQFDERHRDELTHRLGNQTLLEAALNRELGNTAYSGKREVYRRSGLAVTRRVAEEFEAWTVEKIRAHQQWMARQATDVWKISFQAD